MPKADYRTKYLDIRSKFLESSDVAYRLGYADGLKDGAQQAQEQAMAEQQAQEQAMMNGGVPPGEEGAMPPGAEGGMPPEEMGEEAPMEEAGPGEGTGDDMDNHISELENLVAKGEKPKVKDLRKTIDALVKLRKSQKSGVKKQPQIASSQKKFVDNLIAKFDKETKSVTEGLEEVIKNHGLKVD